VPGFADIGGALAFALGAVEVVAGILALADVGGALALALDAVEVVRSCAMWEVGVPLNHVVGSDARQPAARRA
jgi:hypothetical protein